MSSDAPALPDASPLAGWLSAAGLLHLAKLKSLRCVSIPAGRIKKADVKAFQKAHPDLYVSEG